MTSTVGDAEYAEQTFIRILLDHRDVHESHGANAPQRREKWVAIAVALF